MTHPNIPVKLSKGSALLLHLVDAGQVWRDGRGFWVASTERNKRNVHLRIIGLERKGVIRTHYERNFPELTDLGKRYLMDNPIENVLERKVT